jgi:hypothetical protein
MATYIQRNDSSKAEEIAHELIQSHPDNLAGLVVAVQGSGSKLKSQETAEFAKRGMQVIASAPNNQHLREWNDLVSLASQVFKNQGTQDKSLSDVSVIIRHRYCTFRPVV